MRPEDTVKTTIRLPADLHWRFQAERARRRLSNEQAIREAFAFWIANAGSRRRRNSSSVASLTSDKLASVADGANQQRCVQDLLEILGDRENPSHALAVTAVLRALAGNPSGGQTHPDMAQGGTLEAAELLPDAADTQPGSGKRRAQPRTRLRQKSRRD